MDDLEVGPYTIPSSELEERFETSGGPGGQHANRNETAVHLSFDVIASSLPDEARSKLLTRIGDVVEASAVDSRSQFRNRALARQRLKERIEQAFVDTPERRATKPTRSAKKRRVDTKRARGEIKRLRKRPSPDD